jgi:hypothetical protein
MSVDMDRLLRLGTGVVRQGSRDLGTAFRIAPQYAVTAAHVVVGLDGSEPLTIRFDADNECAVEIAEAPPAAPAGRRQPFPDLAVLTLDRRDCPDVPCVMMGEPVLEAGARLRFCGFSEMWDELAVDAAEVTSAMERHLRVGGMVLRRGHSGGPVASAAHRLVVGVAKASEDIRIDVGGLVTPLLPGLRALCGDGDLYQEIVRAHDLHHATSPHWRCLGNDGARMQFAALLGHLAAIPGRPSRGTHETLLRRLCPLVAGHLEPGRLIALRDLAVFLDTELAGSRGRPVLSGFCHAVPGVVAVPSGIVARLVALAGEMDAAAGWHGAPHPIECGCDSCRIQSAVVIGVITRQERADQRIVPHRAELYVLEGDEVVPRESRDTPSYPDARRHLQRMLDEFLGDCPADAEIHIALPDEHLNSEKPFAWPRRPQDADDPRTFGDDYDVILRRSRTWEKNAEQNRKLKKHWDCLKDGTGEQLCWIHCRDQRDVAALHAQSLHSHAFGVFDPPSPAVLRVAEINAFPLMVWRASDCTDHGRVDPCGGTVFYRALTAGFAHRPATAWPAGIARARTGPTRGQGGHADSRYAWRDVVCLQERPGCSKPLIPLAGTG